jgi:hypothetical protein
MRQRGRGAIRQIRLIRDGGHARWCVARHSHWRALPSVARDSRQGPLTKVPMTGRPVLGYSGYVTRSAATAPVERLDKRTLPVRRPDHHTAPAPLSACEAENTRVAAQAQTACGAPESTKNNTT